MIYGYLEKNLLRAVKLVDLLMGERYIDIMVLSRNLKCTPVTVRNDISYLKNTLDIDIMENNSETYKIDFFTLEKREALCHKIYAQSLFLKALEYFLVPSEKKYIDFIDEQFISVSKGYLVKENVEKFLKELDLEVSGNQIIGNVIRIRFLSAILFKQFGMNTIRRDKKIIEKSNNVLYATEKSLDVSFSKSERHFFGMLLLTAADKKLFTGKLEFPLEILEAVKSYPRPIEFEEAVEKNFKEIWGEYFESEYLFSVLSLMIINTHVFDQTMSQEKLFAHRKVFLQDPHVERLIDLFEKTFFIDLTSKDWFLTAIFIFLKDVTLNLHPLLSTDFLRISESDPKLYQKIKQIIKKWNVYGLNIPEKHIELLCYRLSPFMFKRRLAAITLISSNSIDCQVTEMLIKDFLSETIHFSVFTDIVEVNEKADKIEETLFLIDKKDIFSIESIYLPHYLLLDFPPEIKDIKEILTHLFI
ncbi:helix-turn-helix domain-containing protein [Enterococcus sp. BWT-B8]|uniref:helix-turn-helix domain-containing protein n=1 Tax=Enterococcus sp. BWT-B8 TaxID=2885157 RepID=UPI001E5D7D95|nr:helix-turn-helix domain-containing protein [Enterococcus sp. BWT-B8]MCB5952450.1 helix-turn-helix domain-containing protein [Enterococcus sp. BWT-B8]